MKTTTLGILLVLCAIASLRAQNHPIEPHIPVISLFESTDTIRAFLKKKTKYDYSDRNLIEVSLKYFESHPRKGEAWVYRFAHRTPTRGNDLSIFHYTDGEIIEFHHGP